MTDFNQQVIEEFRANRGKVGGMFEGAPLVLLTTVGARSGRRRTNPAVYLRDGERILVFASNAGADAHPAWYHNVVAQPRVTVELGEETFTARAVPLEGAERERMYARQAALDRAFAAYQAGTSRVIPVVALHPERERLRAIGGELVRIHAYLRGELARLRAGEPGAGEDLRAHCAAFCEALTFHHSGEDRVAFPHLERLFPELKEPLDRLRDEHVAIARLVEELRGAPDAATLDRIAAELEAHFAYEEERLVPVLDSLEEVPWES
ncbi:deazaflavin-dependent oxidoreductase (nitroreductase family) [Nonomuraea thailandensis]|uniref:Deazaflavin-dependent oxidoreductase (Nitroreductase family) n=1 Tax=Nonomuraea thailandensis TaxID=1188745 RepID=A0A9X2GNW2_9ACTN|nr:nitroreductase/quinone reductase family protein [Nonomuraea thailandensis]MCP2361262.1 deazaflavin-dependent oxidoreductase (nitroreductase family) [Nonomuraea thailandensis]